MTKRTVLADENDVAKGPKSKYVEILAFMIIIITSESFSKNVRLFLLNRLYYFRQPIFSVKEMLFLCILTFEKDYDG